MSDRRYNAKLILPEGEPPSLIVYLPPTLSDEEFDATGRQIIASLPGVRVLADVEDEEGRGTTTEDMLDAGLFDTDGVPGTVTVPREPTQAMLDAADKVLDADPRFIAQAWRVMVAAYGVDVPDGEKR